MSLLPRRLRLLWSGRDAAASDTDQTLSEADQTGSDFDQSLSDRDQAAAIADQRTSDIEQEIADRLLEAVEPTERPGRMRDYERAHAERDEGTMSRVATSVARNLISVERDEQAGRRDDLASDRDRVAGERDEVADQADREAESLSREAGDLSSAAKAALDAATSARTVAAGARQKAASDRERAARDREAAARDREYLCGEMERAQLDEVTGAYRRGMGEILLRHEMSRAVRVKKPLTLAFVDADGLKGVNTREGHAAGDALLQSVYRALEARLRPYDPIVRWGGDEFVCAVAGASLDDARARIERAQGDLTQLDPKVTFTFGLGTMEAGDTIGTLVDRADRAQREAKRFKSP
ncbi:MAG TPA: GGDEF domain-containing protein [Solirubrobacterales bacterium]|jgi:diguanylate cyclase (GGDEF)-like protein|nr:GGDEF domain-containing protein [Solirubrobacterales bacterium]